MQFTRPLASKAIKQLHFLDLQVWMLKHGWNLKGKLPCHQLKHFSMEAVSEFSSYLLHDRPWNDIHPCENVSTQVAARSLIPDLSDWKREEKNHLVPRWKAKGSKLPPLDFLPHLVNTCRVLWLYFPVESQMQTLGLEGLNLHKQFSVCLRAAFIPTLRTVA